MKKLLSLFLAFSMLLTVGSVLVGCGGANIGGTYYLFENGNTVKSSWVKIDGSKWSDSDGMSGDVELKGEKIYFYVELGGTKELLVEGTLKDAKLSLKAASGDSIFYLDGKAPKDEGEAPGAASGELEFTLNSDGDTYALTGLGTFKGTRLEIPSEYNGKAVTAILGNWSVNKTIKEIIIPDSVTVIGMRNNGVSGMFEGFTALEYIDFGNGIKTIPKKVCNRVKTLHTVVIGSNVTFIEESAFNNTGIVTLTIPEGVGTIGLSAFQQCEKLQTVNLPLSLTRIYASAFQSCKVLKTVNYAGSEDDFFLVSKEASSFKLCPEDMQFVYGK